MDTLLRLISSVLAIGLCPGLALAAPAADLMTAQSPAGYYVFQKVVYQNDGDGRDDPTSFKRLLLTISGHIEATDGGVEMRVVSFRLCYEAV